MKKGFFNLFLSVRLYLLIKMADTHKDLEFLRFFYSSEESMKDKDILKNQAYAKYQKNCSMLFLVPAALQIGEISTMNIPSKAGTYKYLRQLKFVAFFGGIAAIAHEKYTLDKKMSYYNKFYPEPT